MAYWKTSFSIFKDNILFGCGFGNFPTLFNTYRPEYIQYSVNANSFFLQILSELGILGVLGFAEYEGTFIEYIQGLFNFVKDNFGTIVLSYAGIFNVVYFGTHLIGNLKIDHQKSKAKRALKESLYSLIEIFPNDVNYENFYEKLTEENYPLAPIFQDMLRAFTSKKDNYFEQYFQDTVSGKKELLTIWEILKGHTERGGETDYDTLDRNIDIIIDYFDKMPYENGNSILNRFLKIKNIIYRSNIIPLKPTSDPSSEPSISKIIKNIDAIIENPKLNLTKTERTKLINFRNSLFNFRKPSWKLSIADAKSKTLKKEEPDVSYSSSSPAVDDYSGVDVVEYPENVFSGEETLSELEP